MRISASQFYNTYARPICNLLLRNKTAQLKHFDSTKVNYLNVGPGDYSKKGFINLDYDRRFGVNICWDIRKGLPFPDNSIQGIFTEHCLEHLSSEDCKKVLLEFKRILRKGGCVRIVLPDGELYFELYHRRKKGEKIPFPYERENDFKTPMMHINDLIYNPGHQYIYDAETLQDFLTKAGFADIRRESFLHGRDAALLIEQEYRFSESFVTEASKP
jgi:predicted SAM-dependent methyltransferase